ncbi:MAG TPA: PQQ-binding-like beta-propeller repeat protein [Pyrinomonadaceae bacterium]|nr:PQQ-binding-like beta-propeller repeat protein [Pyrinomonadaceae bacterium]
MRISCILLPIIFLTALISYGQPAWQANLDSNVRFYQTTDFGVVLVGTERSLFALDGQTGERIWRRDTGRINETAITPVPDTDLILFSRDLGSKSRLEAVDVLSGATIWQSEKVKGDVLQLAVDPASDLIAVVLVKDPKGDSGGEFKKKPIVHVLKLSTGDELWKRELESDIQMMPARFGENLGEIAYTLDNYRAPLLLDGRLFLFYEGATSYDAQTGNEREREKFTINEEGLALTEADPVFDDKNIYISGRGRIRAVDRRTGNVSWKADDLGISAEMALIGNVLYVRTGGQFTRLKDGEIESRGPYGVSAIDTKTGETLWRYKGADKGLTNFAFADANTILIADRDDLRTIDAKTGKQRDRFEHKVEQAQFVILNERGDAVVGGKDTLAAFDLASTRAETGVSTRVPATQSAFGELAAFDLGATRSETRVSTRVPEGFRELAAFNSGARRAEPQLLAPGVTAGFLPAGVAPARELWRVRHKAPGRGVLRIVAGIALRATALYFRYGGLATSAFGLARQGLNLANTVNSFRWSGLRTRFGSFDLTTLASNSARNYFTRRIYTYGSLARWPNAANRITGLQIQRPSVDLLGRVTPSKAEVRESIFDRFDATRYMDKLSNFLLRRKRLAELRGSYMYFYTDLAKPFDRKGLVGVNIHNGKDARVILASDPDQQFVTDETENLLYSAEGSRLQAYEILSR